MILNNLIVPIYNGSMGNYWFPFWDIDLPFYKNFPIGIVIILVILVMLGCILGIYVNKKESKTIENPI